MKKSYFKPSLNVVRLQSSPLLVVISGEDTDDSTDSKKFEGTTGFLWEDNTEEQ